MEPRWEGGAGAVDLSDFEFWARPLPEREGAFAALRADRPMPFYAEPELDMLPSGPGYFALTRYADILEASRAPEVFCSSQGATSIADMPAEFLEFFGSMINMDNPVHARLRRIVARGFTPRMLARLEEGVQAAAGQIVDDVIDRGSCDFVTEVAARLPLKIICDMMGIPESDYKFVFDRSNIILGMGDPEYVPEGTDVISAVLGAGNELAQLVQELGRHRSQNPTEDLTSALVNAEIDGERLTDNELGSFFILLVVAGNETTRNAISHGMKALSDHPDQRRTWATDFEALAPAAVEEIVRWATPVIFMRRTVVTDTVLSGQELPAGSKVLLFYNSANRDEAVFKDPFSFNIRRDPNPHVGFGGPGPHFCLGAHLARREITVMFRELFRRVPDIEASSPPDRLLSNFINGIKHLEVEFAPGGQAA
ncbi:MAG: cytochrome P450 [Acidimicrobiales bacterium]